jgi:hypothetical protein
VIARIARVRPIVVAMAAGLTALAAAGARAADGDSTLAEALFREGVELMRAGDFARACPKLAESYHQDPGTGALLALARCQEGGGQLASAWATYSSVVGIATREGRGDRAEAARKHAAALEPRLSRIIVEVPAEIAALRGLAVRRDGVALPREAWGSALPVDPGAHVVEATADGKTSWQRTVRLDRDGSQEMVRIPSLEPVAPPQPAIAAATTTPPPPPPPTPSPPPSPARAMPPPADPGSSADPGVPVRDSRGSTIRRTLAVWTAGAGLLALGVGTAYAIHAKNLDDQARADNHCDTASGCDDVGYNLNTRSLSASHFSTGFFVAGGVLVAGATAIYLLGSPRAARPGTTSLHFSPVAGAGGVGVTTGGTF